MTDPRISHVAEFHMQHDPDTRTVKLRMVALTASDERVVYEGEGIYVRSDDAPRSQLSVGVEPIETGVDGWVHYMPSTPIASASCVIEAIELTKPMTRVVTPLDVTLFDRPTGRTVPLEALRDAAKVLAYVSAGRGYVDVEPYPDALARRALGALDDAGLLTEEVERG